LTSAEDGRAGIADAGMFRGPTEEYDTCVCSQPSGILIEIKDGQCKDRQYNLRSWLTKRNGRAAIDEEDGPRKRSEGVAGPLKIVFF
jgi:hypothetical protein